MIDEAKQYQEAVHFANYWKDKGYEKGQGQAFWLSLLNKVFGVEYPEQFIEFEDTVKVDNTNFIDGYIPETKVLIEQKGKDRKLDEKIKQADGTYLTPLEQALRYIIGLPVERHPVWVILCNFQEIWVYNMHYPRNEPVKILLADLPAEVDKLKFLVDKTTDKIKHEVEISMAAGELIGNIYRAFTKQYIDISTGWARRSLNALCVRLVFCLYADDAGVFGGTGMFRNYLKKYDANQMRKILAELFNTLNTKPEDRDPYDKIDSKELSAFPYVNGGLFADTYYNEIPAFDDTLRDMILAKASGDWNWRDISPTIFGAVFESTLNPETRRNGGMHYTSIETIHKVIDPLFLNDLKKEFAEAVAIGPVIDRQKKLNALHNKISDLQFLDPACGSGNFLTETFIELRRLENQIIKELMNTGASISDDPIKVSIEQFHGLEINNFAVAVAKTALWIAENQMLKETEIIIGKHIDFLPLKSITNIYECNAMDKEWDHYISPCNLDYIIGNPPFSGCRAMSKDQKEEILSVCYKFENAGRLDYVAGWFKKCVDMMKARNANIRSALISTNSVSQGEGVSALWKPLFKMGVHIDFAHRTFAWNSESPDKAEVHCVAIGFSVLPNSKDKVIYDENGPHVVNNINAYLIDARNVCVDSHRKPLCNGIPKANIGISLLAGKNYLFSKEERDEFIKDEPKSEKYFRPWYGSYEIINNKPRYVLWLYGLSQEEIDSMPKCAERVKAVKDKRASNHSEYSKKAAKNPTKFGGVNNIPKTDYIVIPIISSSQRKYIPITTLPAGCFPSKEIYTIQSTSPYIIGILSSRVHTAWVAAIAGRLKSDYRYSGSMVYNGFPWPDVTDDMRTKIEKTAQGILDARKAHPNKSLADLYKKDNMPADLEAAHNANDAAVMKAYGYSDSMSDTEIVDDLLLRYQNLTNNKK